MIQGMIGNVDVSQDYQRLSMFLDKILTSQMDRLVEFGPEFFSLGARVIGKINVQQHEVEMVGYYATTFTVQFSQFLLTKRVLQERGIMQGNPVFIVIPRKPVIPGNWSPRTRFLDKSNDPRVANLLWKAGESKEGPVAIGKTQFMAQFTACVGLVLLEANNVAFKRVQEAREIQIPIQFALRVVIPDWSQTIHIECNQTQLHFL